MKTRILNWQLIESPTAVLQIEDDGEERRVSICKPSVEQSGLNITGQYHEEMSEWEWFLDFATINTCHSFYQYHIISQVLRLNEVDCIVELGTHMGGLALYLGVCGAVLGVPVYTFDRDSSFSEKAKPGLDRLGVEFHELDYMTDKDKVLECIAGRKVYLICDGDNMSKTGEFNSYVPDLAKGSVVSVHDWLSEVSYADIKDTVDKYEMRPFGVRDWMRHLVMFATFVKEK